MNEATSGFLIGILSIGGMIIFGLQTDKIITELRRIADGIWRLK